MNGKALKYEVTMSNYEQVNPEFMRVKINVCYSGENRNDTSISRTTLDEMAKSIYGVPVVGEIDSNNMKFKGHGGKLEITDEGVKESKTTIPYGFVDPTTPAFYETIFEEDGTTYNDYLTVSAILWRGRYSELDEIFEKEAVKQSMEIYIEDGEWNDSYTMFNITKARFQALCLLGVEPCFESAKATISYSLDETKNMYQEMMETFKKFTLETAGGENMEEKTKQEPEVETVEEASAVEENVQVKTEVEDVSTEPQKVEEVATDEHQEETSADKNKSETEEDVEEAQEEKVDYQAKCEELEVKYAELQTQFSTLQEKLEATMNDNSQLLEFKQDILKQQREEQEELLFSQYPQLEGVEEFAKLKTNKENYSLEELENQCLLILGKQAKQSYALKQPKQQKTVEKIKFESNVSHTKAKPYGGLLD